MTAERWDTVALLAGCLLGAVTVAGMWARWLR